MGRSHRSRGSAHRRIGRLSRRRRPQALRALSDRPDALPGKATDDLSPDPDDRIHAAACIHGSIDVLLTRNTKHFRARALAEAGVKVMDSDQFLCALLTRRPKAVTESFTRASSVKKNPPITPGELADRIATAGTPRFAARIQPRLAAAY